jgi:DNA-binding CsgD family transcriptional regulator
MQPTNARDLRAQLKQTQSENASLRLLNTFGKQLLLDGWSNTLAQTLLVDTCQRLGATHGLIAQQTSGTLTVLASYGHTFPQAARIPITGGLGAILKNPCHFKSYEQHANLWLDNIDASLSSSIMPLASAGQSTGLLAFAYINPTISEEAQQLCQTLAGLIGSLIVQNSETQQSKKIDMTQLDVLTPREREIFALMPAGYSNAELGKLLGISGGTAKIHVEKILAKLNLRDRTQAAVKAVEFGYNSS